jgi:hypothetical protein
LIVDEALTYSSFRPYMIKIDIEKLESNLSESRTDWIDNFLFLNIELHDWILLTQFIFANFLTEISKRKRNFVFRNENVFIF